MPPRGAFPSCIYAIALQTPRGTTTHIQNPILNQLPLFCHPNPQLALSSSYKHPTQWATRTLVTAQPAPRLRRIVRSSTRIQDENAEKPGPADKSADFPMGPLMSAYQSKALPFQPSVAASIVDRYTELRGDTPTMYVPKIDHGKLLCEEFNVTPPSLFLLGYILTRTIPARSTFFWSAAHLIEMSSQIGVIPATIFLYQHITSTPPNPTATSDALLRRKSLTNTYIHRLETIVQSTPHGPATYVLAQAMEARKALGEAKRLYKEAGERGVGEGWLRYGQILSQEGPKQQPAAKDALLKSMALDIPEAYYLYVMLCAPALFSPPTAPNSSTPTSKETQQLLAHLHKSAVSGHLPASHALATHYHHHAHPQDPLLAKEWYMLAASSGHVPSMLSFAKILWEEGDEDNAMDWEGRARGGKVEEDEKKLLGMELGRGVGAEYTKLRTRGGEDVNDTDLASVESGPTR